MNMFLCLFNAFLAGTNAVHCVQNIWNHHAGTAAFNGSISVLCLTAAIVCYGK